MEVRLEFLLCLRLDSLAFEFLFQEHHALGEDSCPIQYYWYAGPLRAVQEDPILVSAACSVVASHFLECPSNGCPILGLFAKTLLLECVLVLVKLPLARSGPRDRYFRLQVGLRRPVDAFHRLYSLLQEIFPHGLGPISSR